MLAGVVSTASCISIPKKLGDSVSQEGALMTSVSRLGPFFLIRTGSIIPGRLPYKPQGERRTECRDGDLQVAVEMPSGEAMDSTPLCRYLIQSVRYAARTLGITEVNLQLSIHFARQGHSIHRRERFWVLDGTPRASYWIPLLSSESDSVANMIASISHEATHLLAGAARMPPEIARSERVGHLVGACAELELLGELKRSRLSLGYFNENLGLPSHVMKSSRSGAGVARDLFPFFDETSVVSASSVAGQRMRAYCHSELSRIAR